MRQLAFAVALAAIAATLAVPGLAPAATRNNTLIGTDGAWLHDHDEQDVRIVSVRRATLFLVGDRRQRFSYSLASHLIRRL